MADTPETTGDNKPAEDTHDDVKPGLTEQEKAALAAEDDADQVVGAAADGAAAPAAASPQAPEEAKADGDGAGASADAEPAPEADKPAAPPDIPRGRASLTELTTSKDIDVKVSVERLTTIDDEIAALDKKYEAGDIEAKDYTVAQRGLTTELSDLKADLREVGFVENANAQLAHGDWNKSVDMFLQSNTEFEDPILSGGLNSALNTLYADEKNLGASHNWYLETAKRAVLERITPAQAALDAPPGDPAADPNAKAVADAKAAAAATGDAKDKLPKTLGDVPSAGEADVSADEFAALDGMSGMELEARLAAMTPEQQDAYLRG